MTSADQPGAAAERAHHVQAVERELLERLPCGGSGPDAGRCPPSRSVNGVAERIAQGLRGVFEGFELLHHRQRIQRRRRARLDFGDPLLEVRRFAGVLVMPREQRGQASASEQQRQARRGRCTGASVLPCASPVGRAALAVAAWPRLLLGDFFFVEVAVGLDRAGQLSELSGAILACPAAVARLSARCRAWS